MKSCKRNKGASVKARKCRTGVSLRGRLWGYLCIFVAFVLVVLWVFQVGMLYRFYEDTKQKELRHIADTLKSVLGNDGQTAETVYHCASEYETCIRVFRINETVARSIASAEVSGDCVIHHLTDEYLARFYRLARENDGVFVGQVQFLRNGMVLTDENGHAVPELSEMDESEAEQIGTRGDASAIDIRIVKGKDGRDYVLMLDATLIPVRATVSTLKTQFVWIAAILLIGALLMAAFLSRRISRPLTRMTRAAGALAEGQYDRPFEEQGYRETRELAATLNYAAAELSKTDALQRELIANVSHDLRTPLTMIRGWGEVMRDLPGENTPENLQLIIDETERLSELVGDMLDLSRFQAGTRQVEQTPFDLTETVRSVMARYERLTAHEGYTITYTETGPAWVCADRTMILQVVYNFINNAVNYSGEDCRVEVEQTTADGYVRLTVRDFGAGIAPEQLPLIWDRYYKIDRHHRRASVGTGLGLSIAKQVLERHGARYGVRSTLGQGSEFWFELPLVAVDDHNIQGE